MIRVAHGSAGGRGVPALNQKGDVMRTPMTALLSLACVGLVLTTASRAQNAVPPPTFDRVIRGHAEGLITAR